MNDKRLYILIMMSTAFGVLIGTLALLMQWGKP
jgi:hypothetical protein